MTGLRATMARVRSAGISMLGALALLINNGVADAQVAGQTRPLEQGDVQAANNDGTAFAKGQKAAAESIPDQQVNGDTIPGYQSAPDSLSGLYGNDDHALSGAAASAVGNDAWNLMKGADANRSRIDASSLADIKARGEAINASAGTADTGLATSATQGQCQEILKPATQVFYDATCDIGETVSSSEPVGAWTCPDGFVLSGSTCTKTITQTATVTGYSCPAGYSLSGTTCSSVIQATVKTWTCPDGWSLSGTVCSRTTTIGASISGYSCPAGFTLSGSICSQTNTAAATPVYACPGGWSLSGTSCVRGTTYAATPNYSCPWGFTLAGTTCSRTQSQGATPSYSCPNGGSLSGSSCITTQTQGATPNYSCPNGGSLSGTNCVQTSTYSATASYSCPAGYSLNGTTCSQTATTGATQEDKCPSGILYRTGAPYNLEANYCGVVESYFPSNNCAQPTYNGMQFHDKRKLNNTGIIKNCLYIPIKAYTCPNGYNLNGATCSIVYTQNANASYSCPSGGTLSGTTCTTTSTTSASVSYTCPANYALSGTTCTATQSSPADVSWSCPAGYALSGTTCSATESQQASVNYTCPSGGSLSGTTCSTVETASASVTYVCAAGYSLSGTTCSQTTTQNGTPIYACPTNYALSGSTCLITETASASPTYECPGGYTLDGSLCRASQAATPSSWSCPVGFVLDGQTCTQVLQQPATPIQICPNGGDLIDGACVTIDHKTECSALESNPQCTWQRDTCLDETPSGPCKVTERTYSCPVPGEQGPPNREYVCAGDVYCAGGACQQVDRDASNEFKDALVALGAIDQAHKEFDPDKLEMFSGTRETCHKPVFGLVNCCAGKVSGLLTGGAAVSAWAALGSGGATAIAGIATQFLTTFLCANNEKQLDVKDRLGLCHFVGSYCSSSFLGVCTTKKKTYCCFESKLTRIIQEQGRPQIDKPWGAPKTEQCAGLTLDEFSRLDLSKMDFSEIYSEFLESAKLPDQAQMASDIQTKIKAYYQQNAGSGQNPGGGN